MVKFCTKCGTENNDSAQFCEKCGEEFRSVEKSEPEVKNAQETIEEPVKETIEEPVKETIQKPVKETAKKTVKAKDDKKSKILKNNKNQKPNTFNNRHSTLQTTHKFDIFH